MKRSEEILRVIRLNDQAIDSHLDGIKTARYFMHELIKELKRIADGIKPDEDITL